MRCVLAWRLLLGAVLFSQGTAPLSGGGSGAPGSPRAVTGGKRAAFDTGLKATAPATGLLHLGSCCHPS